MFLEGKITPISRIERGRWCAMAGLNRIKLILQEEPPNNTLPLNQGLNLLNYSVVVGIDHYIIL